MRESIFIHSWAPDDVLDDLRGRYEVDYFNFFEHGVMPADELAARVAGKTGVMTLQIQIPGAVIAANAATLRAIASVSVGVDDIDVAAATKAGVQVTNTAGVLDDAVADFAVAMLLAVGRRIVESDRYTRAGRFDGPSFPLFWGARVKGEMLGIIGLGRIGREVAKRARGFSLDIVYHNRSRVDPAVEKALGVRYLPLDDLLAQARYVLLQLPLTAETRHLIDARRLRLMRRDAYLLNIARGPVVDEAALVEALREERIAGAALDVYEFEPRLTEGLGELDNVVLTSHIASADVETRHDMVRLAARNLKAALAGETPPNPINRVPTGSRHGLGD